MFCPDLKGLMIPNDATWTPRSVSKCTEERFNVLQNIAILFYFSCSFRCYRMMVRFSSVLRTKEGGRPPRVRETSPTCSWKSPARALVISERAAFSFSVLFAFSIFFTVDSKQIPLRSYTPGYTRRETLRFGSRRLCLAGTV